MQKYSIKKLYIAMRGGFQKVPSRRIIYNNPEGIKWIFITRLIILNRSNNHYFSNEHYRYSLPHLDGKKSSNFLG
ncbi:hypothetical protein H5410_047780 [Solanum commersonii]|uniref:Uncharacterized protein n=1 Tax=Solanum commersonii TaxID=4109 RepID=A0A9J5XI47_SOLCO|nr:hypothetical protein H5410_047780 [Solanum commersonii]